MSPPLAATPAQLVGLDVDHASAVLDLKGIGVDVDVDGKSVGTLRFTMA